MISSIRRQFNENFTKANYKSFLNELDELYPGAIEFRLAETPVFVPKDFASKMLAVCENIIDVIVHPSFMKMTENSIPAADKVRGHYGYPQTIVFDFGVCVDDSDALVPMLIEMQGFPSLYAFQAVYPEIMRKHLAVPDNFSQYLSGLDHSSYIDLFKKVLLKEHAPSEVVLLEIKPDEQKTKIDFYLTRDLTGVQPVCISDLLVKSGELFHSQKGTIKKINRIYNRLIFDELHSRSDLHNAINIRHIEGVEWVPHPDWFYRISKYTLPLISHPYVPETYFLDQIKQLPGQLEEFVLKPLFSFAGQGVVIDIQQSDLDNIRDPHNWIIQRKVKYADVIETPDGPAKTEIRIMYLWEEGAPRPLPAINLARLSKGKMIGTRYNKDKEWVGGTVALFEQ
jgi:hypothetical protein